MKKTGVAFVLMAMVFGPCLAAADVDLITLAASAKWSNGDGQELQFGADGKSAGSAKYTENPTLEDGNVVPRVLFLHPQWKQNGFIMGIFSGLTFPRSGGKMLFSAGLIQGADNSDGVTLNIQYFQSEEALQRGVRGRSRERVYLGTYNLRYDGKIDRFEVDLDPIGGQSGLLVIHVRAGNSADSDWAVLTEAKLVGVQGPVPAKEKKDKQPTGKPAALLKHTLTGHSNRIYHTAFSPDGRRLLTASADAFVKIWDVSSGKLIRNLGRHAAHVFSAAFGPKGQRLVSAGADYAQIWDLRTGREIQTLGGHTGRVFGVCFSPDGRRVATSSDDGTVRVWDAGSGKEIQRLPVFEGKTSTVSFSPDGSLLALGGDTGILQLWDSFSGRRVRSLQGHDRAVLTVHFDREGKRLVTAGGDGTIRIWNVKNGNQMASISGRVFDSADFSPDGRFVIAGTDRGEAKIWRVAGTVERLTIKHAGTGNVLTAAFSPDGRYCATAGTDNTAKIWELRSLR